ncbi:MAG: hypothetical protein ACFN4G_08805, partial [Mitsuokella sp.]
LGGGGSAHADTQPQNVSNQPLEAQQEQAARNAVAQGDGPLSKTTRTMVDKGGDAKQGTANAQNAQNAQGTQDGKATQDGTRSLDPNTAALLGQGDKEQQNAQAQSAANPAPPAGNWFAHGSFFWGAAAALLLVAGAFFMQKAFRRKKRSAFGLADFQDKWDRRSRGREEARPVREEAAFSKKEEESLTQYMGMRPDEVLAQLAVPAPRPRASVRAYAEQSGSAAKPKQTVRATPLHAEEKNAPPMPLASGIAKPIERKKKEEPGHFEVRI